MCVCVFFLMFCLYTYVYVVLLIITYRVVQKSLMILKIEQVLNKENDKETFHFNYTIFWLL